MAVFLFHCLFVFDELVVEHGRFDVAGADEPPLTVRDAFDEAEFDGVLGLEAGDEGLREFVVVLFRFVAEHGGFGVESVSGGVLAGTGLAFWCFWSRGMLSVLTICFDLGFGCHNCSFSILPSPLVADGHKPSGVV